tara:strand:+ start:4953 stop:5558 length:606 start_codon:yes stop_codon:yes gene_type:complete
MDYRGDPMTGRMNEDPRSTGLQLPPPPPSSRDPPLEPQGSSSVDWYLFYSPRSKPSMNFIAEAKKIEQICSKINLINFDENPRQMVEDNPWLRKYGVPSLVIEGDVLSGKKLFEWLGNFRNSSQKEAPINNEPSATHLGEPSFNFYSNLSGDLSSEVSTDTYSSIGARQGSEGMNHENFSDSGNPTLSLDVLEAQRSKQLK